ncbi:Phosphoglycerol transferase MdoB [Lachnospiraceae bacterium]|nr:Phosphoglycerol transferase MdoB [Lachnospiraceae bacterium]
MTSTTIKKSYDSLSEAVKSRKNLLNDLLGFVYLIAGPVVILYLSEWFQRNPFDAKWGMKAPVAFFNMIFFWLLALLLFSLLGTLRRALAVEGAMFFIVGLGEYYVTKFRGNTLVPWDIFSFSTAASVAGNYSYALEKRQIVAILLFVAFFASLYFCNFTLPAWKSGKKALVTRLAAIAVIIGVFFAAYVPFVQSEKTISTYRIYDKLFTPTTMTWKDGTIFAFIYDMQFLTVEKPAGYSSSDIASSIQNEWNVSKTPVNDLDSNSSGALAAAVANEKTPNIIVIMCEAFADPAVLGDFKTNEDYMPFIHSLQNGADNTITGYMSASVLGGNTPNTEFEFLTGNTMGFLPEGSIAYQQFVTNRIDSMPHYLKSLGYDTLGMHPYKAKGWDRNRVYPLLGFDKSHFIEYFETKNPTYVRDYVSDESLFTQIEKEYEAHGTEKPFFSFSVTMQNHSEYVGEYDNFHPDVTIDGYNGKDTRITNYLSLEKLTDKAFENLVNYFSKQNDPTVIVFFGDHQANDYVVEPILNLNGKKSADLTFEERTLRYKVPFVIWANYDIVEASNVETSANYLGNMTLKAAGIPLTGYRSFLDDFSEKYPVVTAIHAVSKDGTDTSISDAGNALDEYRKMQYYELFDDKDDFE